MWPWPFQTAAPATSSALVTAPAVEPLDLSWLKDHLKVVDYADDDRLIEMYGKVAREYTESVLGIAILSQTWDQWWDYFPAWSRPLLLVRQPVISVTYVKYTDSSGTLQTLAPANYVVDPNSDPPRIAPAFGTLWPAGNLAPLNAVNVRFVAGYPNAAAIPWLLKEMILVLTGAWYENRSDVEVDNRLRALEIPRQFNDLAAKFNPPLLA